VRYLDICDGNMEEGSLRCDANVSVKLNGASVLGKKVEVKNMNSFRHVQRAIDYEVERQIELLEKGEPVISETRTFDVREGQTYSMRTKEELNDYRYFPDPDLSPLVISDKWLAQLKGELPALPEELAYKFTTKYQLTEYDALFLTETKEMAAYFEALCAINAGYKDNANWLMGPVQSYLNGAGLEIAAFPVPPNALSKLIAMVSARQLSFKVAAQEMLPRLIQTPDLNLHATAATLNLIQVSDDAFLQDLVDTVIKEFPLKVEEYQNGKKGIVAMLMGELMKKSKGKADPKAANELLVKKLKEIAVR